MAIDEAILESSIPTLRLYTWKPRAVSIGYFQSLRLEVNTVMCREKGIGAVRRITGGGAVFHDDELTYSIVCPESMVPADIIESYRFLCGIICNALRGIGLNAMLSGINDITVSGKKVSGSAQTRRNGNVLHHGTILLSVDYEMMFNVLKIPDEKLKGKMIKDAKDRVCGIRDLCHVEEKILKGSITKSVGSAFGVEFSPAEFTGDISRLASKFRSDEWTRKRD
jgi:lipoate-protein ligase A